MDNEFRPSETAHDWSTARLRARPLAFPPGREAEPGLQAISLAGERQAELLVPGRPDPSGRWPLLLLFHGAGGQAIHMVSLLGQAAERHGILLLAPQARSTTWDVVRGNYGPDVEAVDASLAWVMARYPIDPARMAVGGFSDGGSYALSIGLTNGDMFGDILAFSPGFAAPASQVGEPRIFISHGRKDEVLAVERCGRALARRLGRAGYDVDYREFEDGHIVPHELVEVAVQRFLSAG